MTETLSRLYLELHHAVPDARTERDLRYEAAMKAALRDLDHATPRQRNGPCIRAADRLRKALGLSPMAIPGGRPSDGLEGKADD